ncbi:MAG TPA: DUF3090 domain-containing protein [Anaerolineaceae bacterium]
MPRIEIDLNPVISITTDAIGQPGQRVFYIQGKTDERVVTVIVEKVQIQTLALGVDDFLTEIQQRYPDLSTITSSYDEALMRIEPPVDPLFRVGELGLAYDADHDLAVLVVREIQNPENAENAESEGEASTGMEAEPEAGEEASVVRFWCTREQLKALSVWGLEVSGRGRPICPYCGQPMDPSGHFCPKRNGHKH